MNCPKCGVSVNKVPFIRTNAIGEAGIFWCEKCAKKHEPELLKNHIEDGGKVLADLKEILYK